MPVTTLRVTLGAGTNTQVSTTDIFAKQVFFQNNSTHAMRVGDSNTSSTRGALLASGSPGGSANAGPFSVAFVTNLADWYVAGTATDILDVIYIS